jgi:hypothetical protein
MIEAVSNLLVETLLEPRKLKRSLFSFLAQQKNSPFEKMDILEPATMTLSPNLCAKVRLLIADVVS